MPEVQVVCAEDGYRIVVDGEESETSSYGEPVEFEHSDGIYISLLDTPEGEPESADLVSGLQHLVYLCKPVTSAKMVDEGDDEDEDDTDDDTDDVPEPEVTT